MAGILVNPKIAQIAGCSSPPNLLLYRWCDPLSNAQVLTYLSLTKTKALCITVHPRQFREWTITHWELVGGLEHVLFFHILGIVTPTDFHIFQRGGSTTNQYIYNYIYIYQHDISIITQTKHFPWKSSPIGWLLIILRTGGKPMVMNRLLSGMHRIEQLNESQLGDVFRNRQGDMIWIDMIYSNPETGLIPAPFSLKSFLCPTGRIRLSALRGPEHRQSQFHSSYLKYLRIKKDRKAHFFHL